MSYPGSNLPMGPHIRGPRNRFQNPDPRMMGPGIPSARAFLPGVNPEMRGMNPALPLGGHNMPATRFQPMAGMNRPPREPSFHGSSNQNHPHLQNQGGLMHGRFKGPPPKGGYNAGGMPRGAGFSQPPPFSNQQQNVARSLPLQQGHMTYPQKPPMPQRFPSQLPLHQPVHSSSPHHMSQPPPHHRHPPPPHPASYANPGHFSNIRSPSVSPANVWPEGQGQSSILGPSPPDVAGSGPPLLPLPHPPSHHQQSSHYQQQSHPTDCVYDDDFRHHQGARGTTSDRDYDRKERFADYRHARDQPSTSRKRRHSPDRDQDRRESSSRDRRSNSSSRSRRARSPRRNKDRRSPYSSRRKEEKHSRRNHSDETRKSDHEFSDKEKDEYETSSKRRRREESREKTKGNDNEAEVDESVLEEEEPPTPAWIRCSPADLYFSRDKKSGNLVATKKLCDLENKFNNDLLERANRVNAEKPVYVKPSWPVHTHHHHHHSDSESEEISDDSDDSDFEDVTAAMMEEMNCKKNHPDRLHEELWFNEAGEMNDGPLCRCSLKSRKTGIRHDVYPGEKVVPSCNMNSNNADKLYHYRITMSPHTNFLTKNPTIIEHDNHEYIFEGFSLFSHYKLENVPVCKVVRFHIQYTIHWFEEAMPENFTMSSLDHFTNFLFVEILELVDMDWIKNTGDTCSRFHIMPRFARNLPDNGKEILSMNEVLSYLLQSSVPLLEETELAGLLKYDQQEWQNLVDQVRGMIVTYPGKKPSSIRVDQLDREQLKEDVITYPIIVHFGIRPAQLTYAGDPAYQNLWKQYVKQKHLLANKPKVTLSDRTDLQKKENRLQDMRLKSTRKREVTVELSSEGFLRTGIKSDICQHALLLPVLVSHLRFHCCLYVLEEKLKYSFKDRELLQLAFTHPSYRMNFGTNPDHARNSLSNCGIRQPEYGDRRIHHVYARKRGINTLIHIMSRMGHKQEVRSNINHNERLEFLGDAVVEFLTSIHLYFMFPDLAEGGLATYRAAIVQNQHLSLLAKKLDLQDFMQYAHGPDLCRESDLRHAMANCFEALIGALFLDGGIDLSDKIFGRTLFEEENLLKTWMELPPHPLQEEEPNGDRHWVESSPALQKLLKFETDVGIEFTHVRLLARSFSLRNVGYNNLTRGQNQRMEFLGDTVLQLVASEYLFKHFPGHHEGHLSLLRSSLVNKRTQSVVCDDLGMTDYVIYADNRFEKLEMKQKEKADLLEAFIGALYVDKGMEHCQVFCQVCFFPRLRDFIMNQDWNDPKSKLQQCCLTLRELDGREPDIPAYKVVESTGPTNTRKYTVAVYFRGERLASGVGHSIQQAEMAAATNALNDKAELFPQLQHQKKFIEKKYSRKKRWRRKGSHN